MSYCRFQNTLPDLKDCRDGLDDDLYHEEACARIRLIELCVKIARDYGHEVGATLHGEDLCDVSIDGNVVRDKIRRLRERP